MRSPVVPGASMPSPYVQRTAAPRKSEAAQTRACIALASVVSETWPSTLLARHHFPRLLAP
eukprot:2471307-Rhodomonas_salina.1